MGYCFFGKAFLVCFLSVCFRCLLCGVRITFVHGINVWTLHSSAMFILSCSITHLQPIRPKDQEIHRQKPQLELPVHGFCSNNGRLVAVLQSSPSFRLPIASVLQKCQERVEEHECYDVHLIELHLANQIVEIGSRRTEKSTFRRIRNQCQDAWRSTSIPKISTLSTYSTYGLRAEIEHTGFLQQKLS